MSKTDTSVLVSAFKAENPEAYNAIFNLGAESAKPDAMKAGAEVERKRLESIVGESAFDAAGYIAAFGDRGARWFYEKKPLTACIGEHNAALEADYKAKLESSTKQIETLTKEKTDLQVKLGNMPRGNDPASPSNDSRKSDAEKQKTTETRPDPRTDPNRDKLPNGAAIGSGAGRTLADDALQTQLDELR